METRLFAKMKHEKILNYEKFNHFETEKIRKSGFAVFFRCFVV